MSRRREEDHITENEQIHNERQRSEQDNLIKEWILTLNGKTTNQKGFGFTFIFSNLFLLPHEVFHPNQSFSVHCIIIAMTIFSIILATISVCLTFFVEDDYTDVPTIVDLRRIAKKNKCIAKAQFVLMFVATIFSAISTSFILYQENKKHHFF